MASNKSINIPISAEDRFTKTIDGLEQRIARLAGPVKRFQHNIGRLDSFGPRQLRQGFLGLSSAAVGTAKKFAAIVPILGTLTGAASLAGIYRLSSAWAGMGRQLGISSSLIGVAPQRLQALGNAARLAGGSAEGMQQTLQGLANTSFNARTGLDPQALAQFQAFGITAHELKNEAPDRLFERVASQIRKLRTPLERARAAQALFGSGAEAVIPILLQSGSAWQRNIELARRYGVLNEEGVAAANRLAASQTRLELSVEGFGNTLAQTIEPVLSPIIARMVDWISANKELISTRITEYVQRLVSWFNDGGWEKIQKWATNFVGSVERISQSLGGVKRTAEIAGGALLFLGSAPVISALSGVFGILKGVASITLKIASTLGKLGWVGKKFLGGIGLAAGVGKVVANDVKETGFSPWDLGGGALRAQRNDRPIEKPDANGFYSIGGYVDDVRGQFKLTNRSYDPYERYNQREYNALKSEVSADDPRAKVIAGRLSENGFNQAQIAGILANFSQESRFSTTAQNGSHAGLAQWDKDRQEQFRKRYGHALTDGTLPEQVDFFTDDLKKRKAAWSALSAARTPEEAGFAVGRHYEIPGVTDATLRPDVNARARAAGDWSNVAAAWGRGSSSAQQPAITVQGAQSQTDDDRADGVRRKIVIPTASAPPIQIVQASQPSLPEQDRQRSGHTDSGRTQGAVQPHRVTIDINHQNAPAGVQVRTSSNSDQVGIGRLKVHRAMSPDAPSL